MIVWWGEVLMDVVKCNKYVVVLLVDVIDVVGMKVVFKWFVSFMGCIDVFFNNVGMFGFSGEIDGVDLDEFDYVLNVNVCGMFIVV